jgi:hypothetical protein
MSFLKWILLFTSLFFIKPTYGAVYEQKMNPVARNQTIIVKPQKLSFFKVLKLRKELKKMLFKRNSAKSDLVAAAVCGFFAILFLVVALQSDVLTRIILLAVFIVFAILAIVFLLKAAVNSGESK